MQENIKNPDIRIQYARLLDPFFKSLFTYQYKATTANGVDSYPSAEEVLKKVEEFKKSWQEMSSALTFVQQVLGLNFYQTLIDVYVVGHTQHPISSPVVISSTKTESVFVDSLTHELLHRLISDNKQKIRAREILAKLFPKETMLCRNHIVLHAVLEKVYLEFLHQPERLSDNRARDESAVDYRRAWKIVQKQGSDAVISRFRQLCDV
jgi:hypothetical protein